MIIVKKFSFGKATGLQSLTLLKKIYSVIFKSWSEEQLFFQTSLNVYFWMDNELLSGVQSLASRSIFTCSNYEICSNLTIKASDNVNIVNLEQILMFFCHIYCEIGTSKCGSTVWLALLV